MLAEAYNPGVSLGERGRSGYLYAQVDLPLDPAAPRYLVHASYSDMALRVGGRETVSRGYEQGQMRFDPGEGAKTLLVRIELKGSPEGLVLVFGAATPDRRISPAPVTLRLADAAPERLGELFGSALEVKLTPALGRAGEPVTAELVRSRSCPEVPGALVASFGTRPAGALEKAGERAGPVADPADPSLGTARFEVRADAPGRYEIVAEVTRDGKPFASVSAQGLLAEGIERLAEDFEADARKLIGREDVPENAVAHGLLQMAKVGLALSRDAGAGDAQELAGWVASAERSLRGAKAGRDPQAGKTGFAERAYFSEVDESAQPYLCYVPKGVGAGARKWPMVVYLHGYVPSYDIDAWLGEDPNFSAVMEAEGCILAVPFARSNTDFLYVGEDDVLRVIEEMKRAWPVDPRRIYLYGYSMGGSGVWTMLTHYPDRFAAAVVLAGRTDYYLWHGVPRESFPEWKRSMIDCDNPIGLAGNIAHVPVRVYHGDQDWVIKTAQSSRMVEKLNRLGGKAELHWVKGGNHWSLFREVMWTREPVAWLTQFSLPEEPPQGSTLTAFHPRFASAFGLSVLSFKDVLAPVEVRWTGQGPDLAGIRNSRAFRYRAPSGAEVGNGPPTGKSGAVVGPVKEAFRYPFVAVYGTKGNIAERADCLNKAKRFVNEWREYAKGRPPMLADREVTPELARRKNLVLFGTPETNLVLARLAPKLPVGWSATEVEIAGKTYPMTSPETGRGRGLIFCHPNPEAPERLIVVMQGAFWGSELGINHKWDWVPDLILYEDEIDPLDRMDSVNLAVVAGFFGPDWSLQRGRVFVTEPVPAGAGAGGGPGP